MKPLSFAVGVATALLAASSSHAMLSVDFGSTAPSNVAAGYDGVDHTGAVGLDGGAAVGNSIDLSFGSSNPPVSSSVKSTGPTPSALSKDFVSTITGADSSGDYLDIILKNVNAGSYVFTGFFHLTDPTSAAYANAETNVSFSEGGVPDMIPELTLDRSSGTESMASGSFSFASTGGDLTFRVTLTDVVPSQRSVLINGFTIAAVPEAGALLIWSTLSGVAVVRYRGKRRPA